MPPSFAAPASALKIVLLAAAGRADEAVQDALSWAEPLLDWNRALEVLPVLEKVERTIPQTTETGPLDKARFYLAFGRALALAQPADARIDEVFRRSSSLTNDVSEQLKAHFGDKLYDTVIPRNVRLAEAPSHGMPALVYDKQSKGALAYLALAGELSRRQRQSARGALA